MNNKNKAQLVHTVQERDYCNTVIYCSEYRRHTQQEPQLPLLVVTPYTGFSTSKHKAQMTAI